MIVGQNTFGVVQYTQPGYGILPHTRVGFRLATGVGDLYGDQRSLDGFGLDVDVLLTEKEHFQAEFLISLAERLMGESL